MRSRSAAVLSVLAVVATAFVLAYRALGTEPFWGLQIGPAELRFTTPDDPEGMRFDPAEPVRRQDLVGDRDPHRRAPLAVSAIMRASRSSAQPSVARA